MDSVHRGIAGDALAEADDRGLGEAGETDDPGED